MPSLPRLSAIAVALAALASLPAAADEAKPQNAAEYGDFNYGGTTGGANWVQAITVKSPALRSDVKGDVPVEFQAQGMTHAKAMCWQQPNDQNPDPQGHDATVTADIPLDAQGNGTFVFPADRFPNGPLTLRIYAQDDAGKRDIREIQLYNQGGVAWNQGIPKTDPPAAEGLALVYSDDFDKMPTISKDGTGATYCAHKPGGGDFSGYRFSDPDSPGKPFSQVGTYLRIHASKPDDDPKTKGTSGLISAVHMDGTGFSVKAPCYFECRFLAQSAPGTWPAFWLLTTGCLATKGAPADELDVVEAYGGVGPKNPNHPGYSITSHFWKQKDAGGQPLKNINKRVNMAEVGNKSYWSTTFHTYAVKVTEADTIYYLDDIEMLRHPTNEISKTEPLYFMINLAIGGISGWSIDLQREGNATDMYVDYVRVYAQK